MIALVCFLWSVLTTRFTSKGRLELENIELRHQVVVLQRKVRGRIQLTNGDRLSFILLYRWCLSALKAIVIVRARDSRVLARAGFCRYWRWRSRGPGARPPISAELRAFTRRMSVENVLWGAPRIQDELLKLGLTVALRRILREYAAYYNGVRTHRALNHRSKGIELVTITRIGGVGYDAHGNN